MEKIRLNTFLLFITGILMGSCSHQPDPPSDTSSPSEDPSEETQGFYDDYEGTNRVIWQKPDLVMELFGDLTDKSIADIGAGSGHFSKRLATKAKKVIAVDIDQRFIHFLDSIRLKELEPQYRDRLEARLAEPDDPRLAPNEVDGVLIVNTFMYMADREAYLENLMEALTPKGIIVIVDFKNKATPIGPPLEIRLPADSVVSNLKEVGFTEIVVDNEALQYQYMVKAQKPAAAEKL